MVYVCVCVGGAVDVGSAAFSVSSALVLIKLCASRSVGRGSGPPPSPPPAPPPPRPTALQFAQPLPKCARRKRS